MSESTLGENFWDDLFSYMEDDLLIPVIGPGVITCGPDNRLFYPWLASRLADKLDIEVASDPEKPGLKLNDVALKHLLGNGASNLLYTRTSSILRRECPDPGETLRQLASIDSFRLFINAGFDPLLTRAINEVRYGQQDPSPNAASAGVGAFSPNAQNDIPSRAAELSAPFVYHILGKVSPAPDYVIWEDDALEFICELQKNMSVIENLARDLKDRALLLIGLEFSDWLTRFFLRVARQERFSKSFPHIDVLERPGGALPESLIMFFRGTRSNVRAVPCDPIAFVEELARRWSDAKKPPPGAAVGGGRPVVRGPLATSMPEGAVFISYSREDEDAAWRLKGCLEQVGCEVWLDRDRIGGGDDFERKLKLAVTTQASVFISLISATTESKGVGYVYKERDWAVDRSLYFSQGEIFYFPVVIDETQPPFEREPEKFSNSHRVECPDGDVPPEVCERIRDLQARNCQLLGFARETSIVP